MRIRRRFAVIALLAGVGSEQGWSVLYGSLVGNVLDPSRAAVPGVTVRLVNSLTGLTLESKTDAQGVYQFNNIQSGTYEIECLASGFKTFKRTSIRLSPTRWCAWM